MKNLLVVVPLVGLGLLSACGKPAETLTVDCGDKIVTLAEGPLTALRANLAGDNASLAVAACALAADIPAPAAGETIPAKVTSDFGHRVRDQRRRQVTGAASGPRGPDASP